MIYIFVAGPQQCVMSTLSVYERCTTVGFGTARVSRGPRLEPGALVVHGPTNGIRAITCRTTLKQMLTAIRRRIYHVPFEP